MSAIKKRKDGRKKRGDEKNEKPKMKTHRPWERRNRSQTHTHTLIQMISVWKDPEKRNTVGCTRVPYVYKKALYNNKQTPRARVMGGRLGLPYFMSPGRNFLKWGTNCCPL